MREPVSFDIVKTTQFDYAGYEWTTAQIGRDAFGNHWFRAGSGCSCNMIEDESWQPLRDIQQIHSALELLTIGENFLANKADFIATAQGLLK
jgi:hypothetical protein